MASYLQWNEKSTYSKFLASLMAAIVMMVACATGFINIAQGIGAYFESPEVYLNRLSLGEHHITLSNKNMFGNELRYLHLEDKSKLYNTSQISIRLTNKSKINQEYGRFVLAVKTIDGDQWRMFVDYIILNNEINPEGLLNTPVIVKPNASIDIEMDFLVYKGEPFLRKCASEYKISWMDSDFEGYTIGDVFGSPTCNTEKRRVFYPVDTSKGSKGTVYGNFSNRKIL